MKKRILLITSTYRTGEKIYPIINGLFQYCDIDVMNLYQMSPETKWEGDVDLRQKFYNKCKSMGLESISGPKYFRDKDKRASVYKDFIGSLDHILKNHYHLVLFDNNIAIKSGKTSRLYKYFNDRNIPVVASPHGNREFKGYKIMKHIGKLFDFSFVLGQKEKKQLSNIEKRYSKYSDRLLTGGIPSNDELKDYKRGNKYILVIPNFTDPLETKGITAHFDSFTKKEFDKLRLLDLSDKYGCGILIKEKNKLFHNNSHFRDSLKCYKEVTCILDCKDDNKLMSNAVCVISAPSTMAFKSIQMGIPTVLLKKHGMVGNFYDFPGLINADNKNIKKVLYRQESEGKCIDFISRTLEGGLNFDSIHKYILHIGDIINGF